MDEPLPEIVTNMVSRVTASDVGQCRCVSKAWCSLLKTPYFILHHLRHALKNPDLLLLRTNNSYSGIDAAVFDCQGAAVAQGQLQLPGIFTSAFQSDHKVESCSDGLLLLSHIRCCAPLALLLLNPTLGAMRTLPAFPIDGPIDSTRDSFCLGFDPATNDYKVISFLSYYKCPGFLDDDEVEDDDDEEGEEEDEDNEEEDLTPPPIRAEIFSLRGGTWRELTACHVPRAYYDSTPALSLNGSFYWLGNALEELEGAPFLLSFDMKTEVFTKTPMPGSGAYSVPMRKQLAVYNDSLAIIFHPYFDNIEIVPIDLWVMMDFGDDGNGVSSSTWTKLFSIEPFVDLDATVPLGVWGNEVIIQFGQERYNNGVFSYNCDTGERKYMLVPDAEPQDVYDFFYMENLQAYNYVESLVDPFNWGN